MNVKEICEVWVEDGYANECFWESWPEQPDCDNLTPRMVLDALSAEREKALREAAELCKAFGDPKDPGKLATPDMRHVAVFLASRILALIPKDGEKP